MSKAHDGILHHMTKQYIHVYILFKHNWIAVHIITTRKTILTTTPSPMIINEENIRPNIMVISSRSYELIRNHFSICQQKQTRYTFNEHWDRKWGITMEIFLYSLSHNKNICRCQPHHKIAARVIYHLLLGGTPTHACWTKPRWQAFLCLMLTALQQGFDVHLDKCAGIRNAEFP